MRINQQGIFLHQNERILEILIKLVGILYR